MYVRMYVCMYVHSNVLGMIAANVYVSFITEHRYKSYIKNSMFFSSFKTTYAVINTLIGSQGTP